MFVLIVGLLWWFQTDEIYPIYHPQRWLGYYATIVLLYTSGDALVGRIRKKEEARKFSHHSDWLFPGILFVGTLTGILLHTFRYAGWAWATYIMYTIHAMVLIPCLIPRLGSANGCTLSTAHWQFISKQSKLEQMNITKK